MLNYKTEKRLIKRYLEDSKAHLSLYRRSNRIPKDWMFANFLDWCSEQKPQIKYKSKQVFF